MHKKPISQQQQTYIQSCANPQQAKPVTTHNTTATDSPPMSGAEPPPHHKSHHKPHEPTTDNISNNTSVNNIDKIEATLFDTQTWNQSSPKPTHLAFRVFSVEPKRASFFLKLELQLFLV